MPHATPVYPRNELLVPDNLPTTLYLQVQSCCAHTGSILSHWSSAPSIPRDYMIFLVASSPWLLDSDPPTIDEFRLVDATGLVVLSKPAPPRLSTH